LVTAAGANTALVATTRNFTYNASTGNLGVGIAPVAALHLKAGTATANTAPLKIASGTNLTSIEADAFEYDGKLLFHTDDDTTNGHGRALIPEVQTVIRTGDLSISDTTSPGTSIFGNTTRPTLLAGYTYIIEINLFVTKVTNNGTLSLQVSTSTGNFTYASLMRSDSATAFVNSGTTSPVTIYTSATLPAGSTFSNWVRGIVRPVSNCRMDTLAFSSTNSFSILSTTFMTITNIGTINNGNIG
jgi:hypothetical protein